MMTWLPQRGPASSVEVHIGEHGQITVSRPPAPSTPLLYIPVPEAASSAVHFVSNTGVTRASGGVPCSVGDQSSAEHAGELSGWRLVVAELISNAITAAIVYWGAKLVFRWMDPTSKGLHDATSSSGSSDGSLSGHSGSTRARLATLELNEHELQIAAELVEPSRIGCSFSDIGGLDSEIDAIKELIILPMLRPDLFSGPGSIIRPTKGVLFYGEPGVGKTMLCKAIAAEAGASFINLRPSTILSKWFGESQKLVRAVFSLAHKMAPCILFMDEVESFLRDRGSDGADAATMGQVKAEFMALWDGLLSDKASAGAGFSVMVLGATNRPHDIDPAILRRMPRAFHVKAPDRLQRDSILRVVLQGCGDLSVQLDVAELAKMTAGCVVELRGAYAGGGASGEVVQSCAELCKEMHGMLVSQLSNEIE